MCLLKYESCGRNGFLLYDVSKSHPVPILVSPLLSMGSSLMVHRWTFNYLGSQSEEIPPSPSLHSRRCVKVSEPVRNEYDFVILVIFLVSKERGQGRATVSGINKCCIAFIVWIFMFNFCFC